MAIFVFIAGVCEAAYKAGLLPEARDTQSLAYKKANHCLHVVRELVVGQPLTEVSEDSVAWPGARLCYEGSELLLEKDDRREMVAYLGTHGRVSFSRSGPASLQARILATHDLGGRYELTAALSVR